MNLIAISGSLRGASFNTRLSRLMAAMAPEGVELHPVTLHGIPLYDGDVENDQGIPEEVETLRGQIKAADGLILVTPEYNAGMPGVFKNAIDWLTRPGSEIKPTFGGRKTAIAGTTPGAWGTTLAQGNWLQVLRQIGCEVYPAYLRISGAGDVFDEDGNVDDKQREQVSKWLEGFVSFAR